MPEVRSKRLGVHVSAAVPKLWAVLKAKDWSQGDLADRLGTKSSVVNRWLHGDQKPNRRFAKAIELHCGVGQDEWDEEPRKPFALQPTGSDS
jgi:transcriptional regulator with XRE-family HTH domain